MIMGKTVRVLLTAAVLVTVSAVWALSFNAFRPEGIALIGDHKTADVDEEESNILTLSRARELYEAGAVFIDTRSPEEYREGHIKNATHLYYVHVKEEWEESLADIDLDHPIVSYCSGEGCNSSFIVADYLERVGYGRVYIFDGGWPEWSAAGYPLIGRAATPPPLFQ